MHLQLCSLCHCRSFRNLDSNQLNGTIPPQLGNLTKLTTLYTQNRSASIDTVIISDLTLLIVSDLTFLAYYILSDSTLMLKILHLVLKLIVSLSLFQESRLESAQWHDPSSARHPHNAASAVRVASQYFEYSIVLIVSLSLSQGPLLESAQWHHPTSGRQPHDAHLFVRSESHRPPLTLCFFSDMILFANQWYETIFIICEYDGS